MLPIRGSRTVSPHITDPEASQATWSLRDWKSRRGGEKIIVLVGEATESIVLESDGTAWGKAPNDQIAELLVTLEFNLTKQYPAIEELSEVFSFERSSNTVHTS